VDARCGANLAKEASKAASHPVSCALENEESGYGIIVDGKFLRFDDHGNRQARLLLKATQKGSNLKVRVGGHFEGDLIKVSEMETVLARPRSSRGRLGVEGLPGRGGRGRRARP
jgi:hypothetical protein